MSKPKSVAAMAREKTQAEKLQSEIDHLEYMRRQDREKIIETEKALAANKEAVVIMGGEIYFLRQLVRSMAVKGDDKRSGTALGIEPCRPDGPEVRF